METQTGFLLYKCRRCQASKQGWHVPDVNAALMYVLYGIPLPDMWAKEGKALLHIHEIHDCTDGQKGVADLVGTSASDTR